MKLPLFLFAAILLFSTLCGCERQSSLIAPNEAIAIRNIATMNSDAKILETANLTAGRLVTLNDEIIAEWVPIRNNVSLGAKNLANAVTRQNQPHTDLLVLHSGNDISNAEIASVKGITDSASVERTLITLTNDGSRKLFSFTVGHVGQPVAVIASGEIRAVPRIVSPVRNEMVLSTDSIDKVRNIPSAVN